MNDYLTTEQRTLDTISRQISSIVNRIGGKKEMDENEIQALWMELYAIRNSAYDAVADRKK